MYKNYIKRFLDLIFSLVGIILITPFLFLIITCLFLFNKGNVFFLQSRPGKDAKIFKVIKFKTMTDEKDKTGKLLPDEKRITPIGNFIRATSLDELPQLLNVLKGEMSFVGPRPLLSKYLPIYNEKQARRHEVRPGITGWAQVNGRNNNTWKKKFEYDIWYIDNLSIWLDIKILFLTLKKVFKKEGVSKDGYATTETFNGSN